MFLSDNMVEEECWLEINTVMSSQPMKLQHTVQMGVMQNAVNLNIAVASAHTSV